MGSYVQSSMNNAEVQKSVTPANMQKYAPIGKFLSQTVPFPVNSVLVIFSSHGGNGIVYGADGEPIYIDKFMEKLEMTRGKKFYGVSFIFVYQSCRGRNNIFLLFVKNRGCFKMLQSF